jgi:hypothetical protein
MASKPIRQMGRPTRRLDWLLVAATTVHNLSYVITNMLDNCVTLIDNQLRHQDDREIAWQELTIDLETFTEDTDASRRLPEA